MNKPHGWSTTRLGLCDDIDATSTALFQTPLAGCALKLVIAIHRTSNRRVIFRKSGMKAVARARTLTRTLYRRRMSNLPLEPTQEAQAL